MMNAPQGVPHGHVGMGMHVHMGGHIPHVHQVAMPHPMAGGGNPFKARLPLPRLRTGVPGIGTQLPRLL
jgi:hypothetical protein